MGRKAIGGIEKNSIISRYFESRLTVVSNIGCERKELSMMYGFLI